MNNSTQHVDAAGRKVRTQRPERFQIQWRDASLDQLIPDDHRVRAVWAYVESLDLKPVYARIRAVEGGVGRDPVDPKILMALWIFATIEGVSSARHLNRLTTRDLPCMWICGEVSVNYHMLADFRTGHPEFLDELLTDTIATLMHQGIVTLQKVGQDGMRVRASAGNGSFRREKTLKMANGGFRPAYKVQFATDGDARVLVSVDVTNNGSDGGQMAPLQKDVCDRYDKVPATYIVDGGFSANDDITTVEQSGSQVVAPMTHEGRILKQGGDPHEHRPRDSDEMAAFRERMKSPEYKSLLKERPSIAEFPNAECRNRGLHQFRVRGLPKVRTSSLWYAITFNFMRMLNLGAIPS